jgi:hypothetical protein
MPLATHLRVRWQRDQRQHCRRDGEGLHRLSLSAIPGPNLACTRMMASIQQLLDDQESTG